MNADSAIAKSRNRVIEPYLLVTHAHDGDQRYWLLCEDCGHVDECTAVQMRRVLVANEHVCDDCDYDRTERARDMAVPL